MGPLQRRIESQGSDLTRREPAGFPLGVLPDCYFTLVQCGEEHRLMLADTFLVGSETDTGLAADA
jgi:hypothetical protein